jgi:hypothetical protein
MSPHVYSVGEVIPGNGRHKVDPRIENELEARRPDSALSRRDAVYFLESTDFTICGVVKPGYIYRVEPNAEPQKRDFAWIGEMQKALLKLKYPDDILVKKFPDWNAALIESCCSGYWSGTAKQAPGWEFLAPSCTVVEVVSSELVDPKKTKGGWRPLGQTSS